MSDAPALRIAPSYLADPALTAVLAALPRARIVGGAVRDALLNRPVADIDLATPDPPEAVARALAAAGLRSVPTGLRHGTVTAISAHRGFEITTLRRDVETDGRHAIVAFTDDWEADAARRDFTINALSMRADGAVYDYFSGIADLRAGRLRFVGDPATRIAEDYLRILRYFRFFARFGPGDSDPTPDPAATTAIATHLDGLAQLSPERVWSELKRLLAAPDPAPAITLMHHLGVLARVLPEGAAPDQLAALLAQPAPADPILRLAALLAGDPAALAARLRLSSADRDRLLALRPPSLPADADTPAQRRALADTPPDLLAGRAWLAGHAALAATLAASHAPEFPLRGRDLRAAGLPDGPELGQLLRDLRRLWLDGGCTADAAALLARVRSK